MTPGGSVGAMIGVGTLGGRFSQGNAINDGGQVTGISLTTGDAAEHGFLWTPMTPGGSSGTMLDLGTLGGPYSVGNGINDSGQIVGSSYTEDLELHAFIYDGTMVGVGTLGGPNSEGRAINASGQMTGNSTTHDLALHAFLWTPTTPGSTSGSKLDLGTLAGTANSSIGYGVNTSGDVAGQSEVIENDIVRSHAFLYTSESGMVDLNTLVDPVYVDPLLGWELQVAWDINDFGQIVVGGYFRGGGHTFLLTPVPEPISVIPFALATGALLFTFGRRKRGCAFVQQRVTAISCILLVAASPASAAMFNVTSVVELISAIDAANQNSEPDAIALAAGATFTLIEASDFTNDATGLPTISASEQLAIFGNGGVIQRNTDSATPGFRLLNVSAGASLTLENVTLQGGWSTFGGAIYNAGTLTLTGVTVQNSIARGRKGADCRCRSGGNGGPGGWGLGGGIYSGGSLVLDSSVILSNSAQGGQGGFGSPPGHQGQGGDGRGGGLYVAAGSAAIFNTLVNGNSAVNGFGSPFGSGYGGGIYIGNAQVAIDEFTVDHITGNTSSTNYPNVFGPYNLIPNPIPLPGDFNHDGTVDASDYVVWRKNPDGIYTSDDFNTWQANFGRSFSFIGSGSGASANAIVPEPAAGLLILIAVIFGWRSWRRSVS
jgi:probable HAF family extracellular repeat protein